MSEFSEMMKREWAAHKEKYLAPKKERIVVGFSGIDPAEKDTGGGGGGGCKCPPVATDAEYDEMLSNIGLL